MTSGVYIKEKPLTTLTSWEKWLYKSLYNNELIVVMGWHADP